MVVFHNLEDVGARRRTSSVMFQRGCRLIRVIAICIFSDKGRILVAALQKGKLERRRVLVKTSA